MMLRSLAVAAALIAAPALAQAQSAAPAARSAPPAAAAPAAAPAPAAKPKAKRAAAPTATADGTAAKRERSPAQLANDQKMRECGAEWRTAKAAGKTGSQKWNQFLSECRKRKA
jgi:hypothetical protein